jgi:alanyl-tRNA synthetase
MTDRLYYTDPYLRAFDATIARVDRLDGRVLVTLDRTAFYPTSGGQPFDTGRLGSLRVIDVVDEEDGSITHVLDTTRVVEPRTPNPEPRTNPEPGTVNLEPSQSVHGDIDWDRRFDHMQQHTGQHLLSAAFDKLFGVRTLSFHLGAAVSTIDLARDMSVAEIAAAEDEANRVVWEDRPVTIRFADAEEAARLPLRKEPARGGILRLIDVEQFDLSACGGTHVRRTGGVGVIAVANWERFKGGLRLEFLCGGRAVGGYRALRDSITASVRRLSVLPAELPMAIERLQGDAREHKHLITRLQDNLTGYRAAELRASAEEVALEAVGNESGGRCLLVARVVDGDAAALKNLAAAVVSQPGFLAVLVSGATPAVVVVARSSDVRASAQQLVGRLTAEFGGRGGGRSEISQAGGLNTTSTAILDFLRALL